MIEVNQHGKFQAVVDKAQSRRGEMRLQHTKAQWWCLNSVSLFAEPSKPQAQPTPKEYAADLPLVPVKQEPGAEPKEPVFIDLVSDSEDDDEAPASKAPRVGFGSLLPRNAQGDTRAIADQSSSNHFCPEPHRVIPAPVPATGDTAPSTSSGVDHHFISRLLSSNPGQSAAPTHPDLTDLWLQANKGKATSPVSSAGPKSNGRSTEHPPLQDGVAAPAQKPQPELIVINDDSDEEVVEYEEEVQLSGRVYHAPPPPRPPLTSVSV